MASSSHPMTSGDTGTALTWTPDGKELVAVHVNPHGGDVAASGAVPSRGFDISRDARRVLWCGGPMPATTCTSSLSSAGARGVRESLTVA